MGRVGREGGGAAPIFYCSSLPSAIKFWAPADDQLPYVKALISLLKFAIFWLWGARSKKAADQIATTGRPALRAGPT